MSRWIYLVVVSVLFPACAPGWGPSYRGNDGRTGEYDAVGVAQLEQIVWKYRTAKVIGAPLALGPEAGYAVTTDGDVVALDLADGDVLWQTSLGTPAYGTPVVAGDRILIGTDVGLAAVGLDGKTQWTLEGAPIEAAPLVLDAVAYVGDRDGKVLAVDIVGGTLIWEAVTAGPVLASVVRARDSVVVGSSDGGIYALDPATGEPRWTWSASAPIRAVMAGRDRIFVCAGRELIALDDDAPEAARWRTDVGAIVETPPSLSGGVVVVGAAHGALVGLDTTDGSQLFRTELGAPIRGDIAVTNNRLVVPATSNGLEVVDRAGKSVWTFRTDGLVVGVVPRQKSLFVTDADGSVYALE